MKTASVRDLRFSFGRIEQILRDGEEVQITKRRQVVARLLPATASTTPEMPDFMARIRSIYGDERLNISGATLISEDRDNR